MNDLFDTIVAPATPRGESAVAIVRLSGPRALGICDALVKVSDARSIVDLEPRRLFSCVVVVRDQIVDRGLCVVFRGPASFSGEDLVELHLHGNPLIVDLVLNAALAAGARLASAGEFSRRAFLNGKLDLLQVEGLAAAIHSESEVALVHSQRQLRGDMGRLFAGVRADLVRLLGLLELELDFLEDGYVATSRTSIVEVIGRLVLEVDRLLVAYRSGVSLLRGPRILLLGLPNAGKSSLFNALVGFERTLVSAVPGTTRDYVEEKIVHGGVVLYLIDSAGLRDSGDALEAEGISRARALVGSVDRVVFLVDSASDWGVSEAALSAVEREGDTVFSRVFTKSDLAAAPVDARSVSVFDPASIRSFLDWLTSEYRALVSESLLVLTQRQFVALQGLRSRLMGVDWTLLDAELLSYELRSIFFPLDQLSGAIVTEDILNEVFASFCIGK